MGCPCSKRNHPRQSGTTTDTAEAVSALDRGRPVSGHAPRGYTWTGPAGRVPPPAPEPAPAE